MDNQFLQGKEGKELETIGEELFHRIGLNCIGSVGQIKLNDITSGYTEGEHIEFDYIIPENKLCLIGEITGRRDQGDIQKKYKKFIQQINIIKDRIDDSEIWGKLGIQSQSIRLFREVTSVKGFFITTTKEKCDITLSRADGIAVFYKSDFLRLHEYSENIGKWTKNYFLNHFCPEYTPNNGITIYEKDLIKSLDVKISEIDTLADLYTFTKSPYDLLDITHVYRRDELPSLESSTYNYQRPLNYEKLKEIRKNLLIDRDFMFPSNILVILSKKCNYVKDGNGDSYLYIPNKYGSISVIDGQHRLFSYANDDVKEVMKGDCRITVTAVQFKTDDEKLIGQLSAKVFIEINANQTKVEISHLDKIAYELGNDDPKVIATRIIVELNSRGNFKQFFDISS
ncbi:MAG: DGQHR domain-containing protein, partial [Cyanobacteriota bacterium]|nr:DGQHR domain-containing protein [Cyanobacteriota bacterium]